MIMVRSMGAGAVAAATVWGVTAAATASAQAPSSRKIKPSLSCFACSSAVLGRIISG